MTYYLHFVISTYKGYLQDGKTCFYTFIKKERLSC